MMEIILYLDLEQNNSLWEYSSKVEQFTGVIRVTLEDSQWLVGSKSIINILDTL